MFAYPADARFGRILPKSKIYSHAKHSPSIRARFVMQIGEIVWQYKLSPETINLPLRDGITEVQVFDIHNSICPHNFMIYPLETARNQYRLQNYYAAGKKRD